MSWEFLLKARGNSPTKLNFVERYGLDDDKYSTVNQVMTNMRERHSGKMAGNFNNNQVRSILDKLVRQGRALGRPTKEKDAFRSRDVMEYKKNNPEINKSDWKSMVDNLVSKDTLFETIYDNITESMKFNSPSKKDVLKYLQDNYQRHKLWSNLWSVKNE